MATIDIRTRCAVCGMEEPRSIPDTLQIPLRAFRCGHCGLTTAELMTPPYLLTESDVLFLRSLGVALDAD